MKIGLISDIHADLEGLEQALKLLGAKEVDTILCAGDLADRGTEGEAVVQRIMDEKIPTVLGNHDWMARLNKDYYEKFPERNVIGASLLSAAAIKFLTDLPRTLKFEFEKRKILVAHGSPSLIDEYIYHTATPPLFKRIFRDAKTHYVVLGHTHIPMVVHLPKWGTIINPGSVYQNYPTLQNTHFDGCSCAILELPYGEVTHYNINTGEIVPAIRRTITT
jgi:putative phosphoesterase